MNRLPDAPPVGEDAILTELVDRVITEAKAMGTHFIVMSGGEIFCRPDMFDIWEEHNDVIERTCKQAGERCAVIAGTGSSHRGAKMRMLEAAFYGAGFHVVSLSSPTYANFIITASSTRIPLSEMPR